MEIEKKYQINKESEVYNNIISYKRKRIVQSYLSFNPEVRLRKTIEDINKVEHFMIVKTGKGEMRAEYETEISKSTYEELKEKVISKKLIKDRFTIPLEDGHKVELDIYGNIDLMLAEVEFESEEDMNSFIKPDFLGEELKGDKYTPEQLAKE